MNRRETERRERLKEKFNKLGLQHFAFWEVTSVIERTRGEVSNSYPLPHMHDTFCAIFLIADKIRDTLGSSISLLSAYRNPKYNALVDGAAHSRHIHGAALDLTSHVGARRLYNAAMRVRQEDWPYGFPNWVPELRGVEGELGESLSQNKRAFKWKGGIGLYESRNFIHIDLRARHANWT